MYEMEKRHKENEMKKMREKANKKLLDIRNRCIMDVKKLGEKTSRDICLATTEYEMDIIHKHFEEEINRINERQIRESEKVQQQFMKDLMSL